MPLKIAGYQFGMWITQFGGPQKDSKRSVRHGIKTYSIKEIKGLRDIVYYTGFNPEAFDGFEGDIDKVDVVTCMIDLGINLPEIDRFIKIQSVNVEKVWNLIRQIPHGEISFPMIYSDCPNKIPWIVYEDINELTKKELKLFITGG